MKPGGMLLVCLCLTPCEGACFAGDGSLKNVKPFAVHVYFRGVSDNEHYEEKVRSYVTQNLRNNENVIVLGDLNVDEIYGEDPSRSELVELRGMSAANPDGDLIDLHHFLPQQARPTHMVGKQFDRILVSRSMISDERGKDFVFNGIMNRADLVIRGKGPDRDHRDVYYKIDQPQRDLSDHYPLIAEFLVK